jgi:hypothetical protein
MGALAKIVLTPLLIAGVTLLARRWGPSIGGTVVGLPLTSTPVSIFLALEQGPAFAAEAAVGTLLGLIGQAALCLAYSWTAQRAPWWTSAGAGIASFFGATVIVESVSLSLGTTFALVCALLLLTAAAIPGSDPGRGPTRPPAWDLPLRMLVAAAIVVTLTTMAPRMGPRWTGLLSPFPVFALVLGAFTHRTEGAAAAGLLLRGIVLGSLSHATMFVVVASLLVRGGLVRTYMLAALAALAVNGLALWLAGTTGRSRPGYHANGAAPRK